jgi:FKBP-type peptidyl-prolyl cis-trans isomerase SlyD
MNIQKDCAVTLHYHLTDPDGNVIDSSQGSDPMAYLHGYGSLVVGVERALAGQAAGSKLDLVVTPEDGYGLPDPELDLAVPLSLFPEDAHEGLVPGAMFKAPHPANNAEVAMFTVIDVENDEVRCTANHPLAGITLHFNLEVVEVREATEEELSHGHIHGPGGHQH